MASRIEVLLGPQHESILAALQESGIGLPPAPDSPGRELEALEALKAHLEALRISLVPTAYKHQASRGRLPAEGYSEEFLAELVKPNPKRNRRVPRKRKSRSRRRR